MPIYISEEHYKKNLTVINNSLTVLKYGPSGIKKYDFYPEIILDVMPTILNMLTVNLLDGKIHQSVAAIEAYCHIIRLMIRFIAQYPEL